ncbi:MAG TPA: hypothetical protein VF173_03230 [Thermoanaerobaculia bacterium]|nr:hypothetical protein [Thermoanaerobaculia bacterium]
MPIVEITGLSNAELFERYAAPARVGLAGGHTLIDRTIRKAQRSLTQQRERSLWSHAFVCSGRRIDGHHWVLESDLEIHRKQVRLGVQENRAAKYLDDDAYPNLAILDFGLTEEQARLVMTEGLELLAGLARYSLRELMGTLLALQRPTLRGRDNLLSREGALYCSAMVQHCYTKAGIEFVQGVVAKNTTPQDISGTAVPHTAYVIRRSPRLSG